MNSSVSSSENKLLSRGRTALRDRLMSISRPVKRVILMFSDAVVLSASLWVAMTLRYGTIDFPRGEQLDFLYFFLPALGVLVFWLVGLYRSLLRSMEGQAIRLIAFGAFLTAMFVPFFAYIDQEMVVPRSVPFIYFMLVIIGVGTIRIALKELYRVLSANSRQAMRVLIYGAGGLGTQLAALLQGAPEYRLIGFIDDDPTLRGQRVRGRRVYNVSDVMEMQGKDRFDEILLAFFDPTQVRTRAAVQRLESVSVPIKTVPRVSDMMGENGALDRLRDLRIEDLLGRQTVEPIEGLINGGVSGKSILITGSAGSIGSELCRQILEASPRCVVAFDLSEIGLYTLGQELAPLAAASGVEFHLRLGSVSDKVVLDRLIAEFDTQIFYHAAAYKHVPMVEDNIAVAVENNVFGTRNAAQAAADAGIERFVLISTDKAVRPTNVMGATKRLAELVVQDIQSRSKKTVLSMVRFGNVLGSSGSVIPLFRKQIEHGGPLTLTHKNVTRYFMTISEAAQLVLQAGFLAKGGEVFLLDMGEPVRLEDLARLMVQLAGKRVSDDSLDADAIEIREVGLRPGEKLYEELLIGDNAMGTRHPKIMQAQEEKLSRAQTTSLLKTLQKALEAGEQDVIVDRLKRHANMVRRSS